jgi:hypothetical protein
LWSWIICVAVTAIVSLLTEPKPESDLVGLVYGVTLIPDEATGETMHDGGISIWFFIGVSLLGNGILIVQAGIRELLNPPAQPVVLFHLHANIWWGGFLLLVGVFYCIRFAPRRIGKA